MDDRQLTALARSFREGDRASFERLVETLTRALIAMAYRYTRDWEWARDVTQETWITVFERIDRYDPARAFRPWLYAVHRNGCLDHVRRARVRRESISNESVMKDLEARPGTANPESDLEREEFHARLLRAVSGLGDRQREVFVRVDLEDGDQREVAEELGMKFATLRTTLHFARKRLAESLRDEERNR